jgi:hypothetical protein
MAEEAPKDIYGIVPGDLEKPVAIVKSSKPSPQMAWENLPEKVQKAECKLCNSKYREEAEELFERSGNITKVQKFLHEDRAEDISYAAVRNHLKYHYEGHSSDQLVREYATEIDKWLGMQNDQEAGMLRAMAMIERELTILEANAEGMSLENRRKNAETVAKLSALLLNYRTKFTEIQQSRQPITFILNQLQIVLKEQLETSPDGTVKQVVKNIMTRLGESCSDLFIEEE